MQPAIHEVSKPEELNWSALEFYKTVASPDMGGKPKEIILSRRACWVDVRDVARALVEALKAPSTSQVGRKRLLLCGEYHHANELTDLIRTERPQLAHRLNTKTESAPKLRQTIFNERFNEILKFDLVPWKKTILDATDALVELENYWKARGKPIYNDA